MVCSTAVAAGKRGEIVVDEYSRTSAPSIWAIGDVTNRINLTPVALMEGMAVAKTVALNQPTKPDYNAVASAVFSWPNMATVVSVDVSHAYRDAYSLFLYAVHLIVSPNQVCLSPEYVHSVCHAVGTFPTGLVHILMACLHSLMC